MKKMIAAVLALAFVSVAGAAMAQEEKPKVILLIAEQNIGSQQRAWWAGEVDLSATEAELARQLIGSGFQVVDPAAVSKVIQQDKAFRVINVLEPQAVTLAKSGGAKYAVTGKAVASAGGPVPQSSMVSYFANITVKLIRVKDGKVIAYLSGQGSSAHMDAISGGTEALTQAAQKLAGQIVQGMTNDLSGGP